MSVIKLIVLRNCVHFFSLVCGSLIYSVTHPSNLNYSLYLVPAVFPSFRGLKCDFQCDVKNILSHFFFVCVAVSRQVYKPTKKKGFQFTHTGKMFAAFLSKWLKWLSSPLLQNLECMDYRAKFADLQNTSPNRMPHLNPNIHS